MTTKEAAAFANRLARRVVDSPLSAQVSGLERDCVTASKLIRALLRQVHSSDVFTLQDESVETPEQKGEVHNTPRETD
jgi:hypothetical protein